jgi:uncharacterized protein (DUF2126 family)/transglutaminase-like putative cysteine protease
MALKVVISHKTVYKYDRLVTLSPHIFRLRPAPHCRTPIESYSIKIKPEDNFFNWQQDPFGNYLARLIFKEKTKILSIEVEIIANLKTINPFDFFIEESAREFPFVYETTLQKELIPYLENNPKGDLFTQWIETIDTSPGKTIDFLVGLNRKLNQFISYTIRLEPGVQPIEITLQKRSGSCRDFAWLLVQTLRHFGFGARFVSGYLVQLAQDVKSLDGPSGPDKDFTDLHAWAEVYLPGAGWIGLDATSGLLTGEGHIPLACSPTFESAAAITGYTDVCNTEFFYDNSIKRIFESPRVTKPYTAKQWNDIYDLGFRVDEDLDNNDVRLTMGGEPTFVSIDDMESAEWNTEANGNNKKIIAGTLSERLLDKFAKGGLVQHTQGKWYPGEPIPRWQIGIYWRKDRKPLWNNSKLICSGKEHKSGNITPELFLKTLTGYLGCDSQNILPAYEDIFYFLWEEGKLPTDVDPLDFDTTNPLVRQKLSEILNNGMGNPVGYILPLSRDKTKWITCNWRFRRKHLFLVPGNSPIGFRLPLDSLIVNAKLETEPIFEPDLFSDDRELGDYSEIIKKRKSQTHSQTNDNESHVFIRKAICAEIRNKKLHIFLPPVESLEVFLDLISSIEAVAEELSIPVIIEGYEPPQDNRLEKIKITPDPGVLEVNIHPSKNWNELTETIKTLYEEARFSRLGTEKFMLDGRHTGTGGGNHVTIGGNKPSDSPILRNPELLQSLLTFWQHHPGLSYLFTGAFIGATSQAPRVDEGRFENLYELEIAFRQIPKTKDIPFWMTDRLFRHLLTDITGNTHRSEFCIDKLYSPDSASGRLGILELRAFDMPPHPQMSLLQMLLVRTIIAWFWKKPYKHKLVRWGTELHDKFLMEHYVREDIKDIVNQLNEAGYPFKPEWFDPFFEFRFPEYGMISINGIQIKLSMAIEPWQVLGEEMTGRGTARYVDSSMERIQVKVSGFTEERYVLSCNGIKIPLTNTGEQGEYVAAIRYKAWKPWSSLHPTLGVDAPLVFDLVDKWNQRSVGGCTYFVSHPGGLSYDTYPVNSFEAESRRINRFWDIGHTQGEIVPSEQPVTSGNTIRKVESHSAINTFEYKEIPVNFEFPHTLDLRQIWKTS